MVEIKEKYQVHFFEAESKARLQSLVNICLKKMKIQDVKDVKYSLSAINNEFTWSAMLFYKTIDQEELIKDIKRNM